MSLDRAPKQTLDRIKPDGLITTILSKEVANVLRRWQRPTVAVSNVIPTPSRCARVFVDNAETARLAAQHFLERSLRHFAFVGPAHHEYASQLRMAFSQWVAKAGFDVHEYIMSPNMEFDPSGCQWALDTQVAAWLRALPKPIGIFTAADEFGTQLLEICRESKIRVPEEIAVLGVENDEFECNLARPKLSSIALPAEAIGYRAASLLAELLSGDQPPASPVLVAPLGVTARRSTDVIAVDDLEIVAAVRYIRENIQQPLTVSDVLKIVPLGRRTLERRCIASIGWGIGAEIRRARLERARWLLANTDMSVKSVARHSGFSEYRHFAVALKQTDGISPTEYRKQHQSSAS